MNPGRYPVHLDLTGRRVLVVGAGRLAARRVVALLAAGACVEVVSPEVDPTFPQVPLRRRAFAPADVDGAWLVLACTGVVDAEVAAECAARQVWCVRGDDAGASAAWLPAVARAEEVTVGVTAGGDPRRAVAVRDAISLALDSGELPVRRHRAGAGRVTLVVAGPAEDLVTVRGRRAVAAADTVLRGPVDVSRLVELGLRGDQVVYLSDGADHARLAAGCRSAGLVVDVVPGVPG